MNLDFSAILAALINWESFLLCMGCYLLTFFIRTIVENLWNVKNNKYWNEIFLPLAPIVMGGIMGMGAHLLLIELPLASSLLARILLGATCGAFSGALYARIKSAISTFGES